MSCEACLEGAFCETNILLLLILGSYDIGLVDDTLIHKAGTVEGTRAFDAVALFFVVVTAGVAVDYFVVVTLDNGLHILVQLYTIFNATLVDDLIFVPTLGQSLVVFGGRFIEHYAVT